MNNAQDPVPMLLWCPECRGRHIDEGEFATKPHHTHACQHCGHVWRPANGPTVGVQFLPGFKNEAPADDQKNLVHELVGALALARPKQQSPGLLVLTIARCPQPWSSSRLPGDCRCARAREEGACLSETRLPLFDDRPRRSPPVREVRLVLPYPPPVNALRAIFTPKKGRARLLDTEVSRAYKSAVRLLLQEAGAYHRWTGALLLELDFFRPRRTGDLGNGEKAISDALQTAIEELRSGELRTHPGLFEDDEQTVELRMRRFEDKEYPRVQVTVRLVTGPAGPPPERWPTPPEWEQALAMVEQAQEKRRERARAKKRHAKQPIAPSESGFRSQLPAGSSPGIPSYGSRHWPRSEGMSPPRRPVKSLKGLATPASYSPLPQTEKAAITGSEAVETAQRGKNDD